MKRIIALSLAFSLIFLCACSDKKADDTVASTTENTVSSTVAESTAKSDVKLVTEWGTNLLPEDFPPPPNGTHGVLTEQVQADENHTYDRFLIQFTCPENEIYRFTNNLLKAGYTGGAKKIDSPSSYYKSGFNGAWQNGKNLIRVAENQYEENGKLTVVIEITECKDNFPAVLTNIFPKFNGYSKDSGLYSEYDEIGNRLDNEFPGSLYARSWTWDFGFERAFVGVTESELEAYVNELVEAEFSGKSQTSVTDGCTVVSYDLIKVVGETTYGVFIAYNQILKTMDILYTNNASLLIG